MGDSPATGRSSNRSQAGKGGTQAEINSERGISLRTVVHFSKGDTYSERKIRSRSVNTLTPFLAPRGRGIPARVAWRP